MRKSSLVKAMACFMAATMAITCVPSANVTNGVSLVAEAATEESALTPVFSLDFEGELPEGCKIVGSGKIETTDDAEHGKVFHNAVGGQEIRTNYMLLPEDTLAKAVKEKGELTISMDVNVGTAADYLFTPLFSAYAQKNAENTWPMMVIQSRGLAQVNCNGWTDLTDAENVNGANDISTVYLDDKAWHKVTVTFTKEKVVYYVDGKIMNEWNVDSTQVVNGVVAGGLNGFLTEEGASQLKYICLGGNQAWAWTDPDPAYLFDNVAIYSSALTSAQVRELSGVNPCTGITLTSESDAEVAVGVPFELKAVLTGEDPAKVVTDTVTAAAIDADIKVAKESDGKEYVLSVTPTKITSQGAVTVTCGSVGKTYSFNAVENAVKELVSTKGNEFSATADQVTAFEIKAIAKNPNIGLKEQVELVTGSAIGKTSVSSNGSNSLIVEAKIKSGRNEFGFKCGDKTLTVVVTGTTSTTGTTTTPGTDNNTNNNNNTNTTPDTTTGGAITTPGGIDTDKPADTDKPNDSTTPGNDNTADNTPDNSTDDTDNAATATKKKKTAKLSSVTAKKGKKAVSGKVTIKSTGKAVKNATVKVYVDGKKKATTTTKSTGKFSVKVAKKLKKGNKVKIVVTKSTIKKVTKTVTVK